MSEWNENKLGEMPCKPFEMVDVWFRDGDLSSGFASDFYWKIDHDIADVIKYKVRDNKTETPEEKEALDGMTNNSELPNGSEWKSGDACSYYYDEGNEWRDGVYVTQDNGLHVVRDLDDDGYVGLTKKNLRKPETPQQREEREQLEAAYDLYFLAQDAIEGNVIDYSEFIQNTRQLRAALAIVDKTGYRKAK